MHDPSSTHSSPRAYPDDLAGPYYPPFVPHHSHTYPIPNYPTRPIHKSTLPPHPISLSVSTSTTASEHDPNEKTARPSNAHKHAQFLSGALTADADPSRSLLFSDDPASSDDPGATPIVSHPPSTTSAAGLPTPLNSAGPSTDPPSDTLDFSLTNTPGLTRGLTRPLSSAEHDKLAHLDRLKFFLATAPSQWDNARPTQSFAPTSGSNAYPSASVGLPSTIGSSTGWGMGMPTGNGPGPGPGTDAYTQGMHPSLNRFMLPSQEFVTCVLWNGLYHITGTDIVRALVFRFEAFGRPVRNMKKFEEGVFSDLRNLKPGVDACLEEPKSPFLDLLFKYQCIRTQKKQKVFYWFSVPHDRLFLDALERDLKREKMGQEPTTHVVGEPALSFTYDPKRSLYEQFSKAQGIKDGEGEIESSLRRAEVDSTGESVLGTSSESDAELIDGATNLHIDTEDSEMSDADDLNALTEEEREKRRRLKQEQRRKRHLSHINGGGTATFFSNLFGLFEGSPTYKQRRKKNPAAGAAGSSALSRSVSSSSSASFRRGSEDFDERGRPRSMGSYGTGLAERHHHQSASVSRERSYPYPHPYTYIHRQSSQGSVGGGNGGQNTFQFSSMSEEFGPGSLDARERAELDAATMFHRQARGELIPADGVVRKPKVAHVLPQVGVMISEGFTAHQVQTAGASGQQSQQQQQTSDDAQMDRYANDFDPNAMFPPPVGDPSGSTTTATPYETVLADGKVRAFMCPLYSCGKLFKRMEHLKRHVRTHTLERPYACQICQKRFSRSDNLNQHLRTHERTGSALANATGASSTGGGGGYGITAIGDGLGGGGGGLDMNAMGAAMGGLDAMTAMGMWRDTTGGNEDSDLSGTESEGFDDEYIYHHQQQIPHHHHQQQQPHLLNDPFGLSMLGATGPTTTTTTGGGLGGMGNGFDMQMCEIEVQASDVSEIPGGEEEGLVLRNHPHHPHHHHQLSGALNQFANPTTTGGDFTQDPSTAQWAQPQPSPAFSVPSPPAGISQMNRSNRTSIGSSSGFMRPTHSTSSSSLSIYNGTSPNSAATVNGINGAGTGQDDYVSSLSAPSHKQAFDHSSLYPPGMLDSSHSTGPTPATATGGTGAGVTTPANVGAAGLAGPIRRHRSMTPSLIGRTGESIRRPMSTVSNTSGGERSGGSSSPVPGIPMGMGGVSMSGGGGASTTRGYHPYAGGYTSSSRSGSTHSSPAVYNVPLGTAGGDGSTAQQQGLRRSESRTSFIGMQDGSGGGEFRTESPGSFISQHMQQQQQQQQQQSMHHQTESPAHFTMELPAHHHHHHSIYAAHSNTLPVGVYDPNTHQPQMGDNSGGSGGGGYYPHTHATL